MIETLDREKFKKIRIEKCLRLIKQIQTDANFRPPLLEYDETSQKLVIADKLFFLWLTSKNWKELLTELEIDLTTATKALQLKS